LLVDSIGEVITAEEDEIEPPPANMGLADGQFVTGVIQLENRLMAILNVVKVLDPGKTG
jgi:purine-binding chemotaxis protein CheW